MPEVFDLCHKIDMPRRLRIDAPGALHHIIVRGIERKSIFSDHTAIMGKKKNNWQDVDYVLKLFNSKLSLARSVAVNALLTERAAFLARIWCSMLLLNQLDALFLFFLLINLLFNLLYS